MKKEEKIVKNNKETEDGREEILEKAAKFSEVGKEYIGISAPELTQEEEILQSEEASMSVKKELVEAIQYVDKHIMKPTNGGASNKSSNIKDNVRKKAEKTSQKNLEDRKVQTKKTVKENAEIEKSRED